MKAKLQRRGRRSGRNHEAEVRVVPADAVRVEDGLRAPLGSRIVARFAGLGLDEEIPELRDQQIPDDPLSD